MNIKEIAHKANVSKSAVSIALNNKPGISEATRKKILAIVKETGYKHRSMVDTNRAFGEKKMLRLLACSKKDISLQYSTSSFFTDLIHCIEKHASEQGYALVFSSIKTEDLENEITQLELNHPSDGIILLATNLNENEIDIVSNAQKNLLVLDNYLEFYDQNIVVMDNAMGAYEAVSYLVDLGHSDIRYVQSSLRLSNFIRRREGFKKALNNFEIDDLSEKYIVDTNKSNVREQFIELIKNNKGNLPTAIFCECDYIAIDVIKAIQDIGLNVPNDISVIGFDNVAEASIISPELTTINVFRDKMAALAVERILSIVGGNHTTKTKSIVSTQLVKRDSCKSIKG